MCLSHVTVCIDVCGQAALIPNNMLPSTVCYGGDGSPFILCIMSPSKQDDNNIF